MGNRYRNHKLAQQFSPLPVDVFEGAWENALQEVLDAAADTAEFASGQATGRSRQVSIRRLAAAIHALQLLEERINASRLADRVHELGDALGPQLVKQLIPPPLHVQPPAKPPQSYRDEQNEARRDRRRRTGR